MILTLAIYISSIEKARISCYTANMNTQHELIQLKESTGLNWKAFSKYYNIPYRTVQDWYLGKRNMPEYLFRLMAYKAELERPHLESSSQRTPGGVAYLSNEGRYTIFRFRGERLKIIGPYSLERYTDVKEWDNGYLVVMAKYSHLSESIEEYIDLIPVLDHLCINKLEFLKPIQHVEIRYD